MHLFIQPVVHGHLGLLWFRAIPNSASMNILVRDFWRTCVSVSFGWLYIQEGKLWVIQEGLFIQKPFVPPPPSSSTGEGTYCWRFSDSSPPVL